MVFGTEIKSSVEAKQDQLFAVVDSLETTVCKISKVSVNLNTDDF